MQKEVEDDTKPTVKSDDSGSVHQILNVVLPCHPKAADEVAASSSTKSSVAIQSIHANTNATRNSNHNSNSAATMTTIAGSVSGTDAGGGGGSAVSFASSTTVKLTETHCTSTAAATASSNGYSNLNGKTTEKGSEISSSIELPLSLHVAPMEIEIETEPKSITEFVTATTTQKRKAVEPPLVTKEYDGAFNDETKDDTKLITIANKQNMDLGNNETTREDTETPIIEKKLKMIDLENDDMVKDSNNISSKKQKRDLVESKLTHRIMPTSSNDSLIVTETKNCEQNQKEKYNNSKKDDNFNNAISCEVSKDKEQIVHSNENENGQLLDDKDDEIQVAKVQAATITEEASSKGTSVSYVKSSNFNEPAKVNEKNSILDSISSSDVNVNANTNANAKLSSMIAPSSEKKLDEIITQYAPFPTLKSVSNANNVRPLRPLSTLEQTRLERLFEFEKYKGETWSEDWAGVLALVNNNEVENPDGVEGGRPKKRSLIEWVEISAKKENEFVPNNSLKLLNHLLRFVYNYKNTPDQAKLILANIDMESPSSISDAMIRISIDPIVLQQDGWTIGKTIDPKGELGGAHRIGEKIWWQGYLGVVIAFMVDEDYGDLWKGMWVEDLVTFDLEAEELTDARKKYERKKAVSSSTHKRKKNMDAIVEDIKVDGIEHGIILATSFARGSKYGVFWPARVMHASELDGVQNKRNRNKKKVDVVFLAPYWNSDHSMIKNDGRRVEVLSDSVGEALFSSGPLFEVESIDANVECIQRYPYDAESGLDLVSLRSSFKLMGIPKDAFSRFLDSQRLALGFKTFSQTELKSNLASDSDRTTAALLEGHPLAVQTPNFPASVLQLPFIHILSQLPHHEKQAFRQNTYPGDVANGEPAIQFGKILDSMNPPACWGLNNTMLQTKETPQLSSILSSPITFSRKGKGTDDDPHDVNRFLVGLSSLLSLLSENSPTAKILKNDLNELVAADRKGSTIQQLHGSEVRKKYLKTANRTWIIVKGETLIVSHKKDKYIPFLKDWRRCCERIFKHINAKLERDNVSWAITDSRCNLHLTSSECFERAVRLPAALKGIRKAKGNIRTINSVDEKYLNIAENDIIARAHKMAYIQRIKKRCMAATGDDVVALTDDSDGNGGEDTKGSKGTWNAAISAVGAALQGVDMIMNGECLNAFCATRPPGHHAGRELHAMKAVSNGFCILNSVACAAIYATSSILQGGLGLSRVCIIDIDVHHGNGTQDILCSTYDPRFLYVSMHAGGPDINGVDFEDDDVEQIEHHLGRNPKQGIFPGRCGDTSPHKGVLNIPLGARVTPHALGTALVTKVTPTVDAFNPELIIISAGFDAHKNDPLNMGGLTAEDFGTLTEVICKLAYKCCSGRVLSVMEGGYGVPCCRPQNFSDTDEGKKEAKGLAMGAYTSATIRPSQLQCLELGSDLPPEMTDVISSYALQKRLDKCHQEGFVHCVTEHVSALARCNAIPR